MSGQKETGTGELNTQESGDVSNYSLDLSQKLHQQEGVVTSENLPKNVCLKLYSLMKEVVTEDVTPKTVSAACNCAAEISKLLRLNHDISKFKNY